MYAHTSFVTSVRGADFLPQIAAKSALNCFGAKRPFPAFFWASATLLPDTFWAVFPRRRFSAVRFRSSAFLVVVVTTVVLTAVFVVVVIAIEG